MRRVLWRPGYECELAIVAHTDQGVSSSVDLHAPGVTGGHLNPSGAAASAGTGLITALSSPRMPAATLSVVDSVTEQTQAVPQNDGGAPIEIWDVRRGFIAKWVVSDSVGEGGVRGMYTSLGHPGLPRADTALRYCIFGLSCDMGPTLVRGILSARSTLLQQAVEFYHTHSRYMGPSWNTRFCDGSTQALGDSV